jgi:hypothetical protein
LNAWACEPVDISIVDKKANQLLISAERWIADPKNIFSIIQNEKTLLKFSCILGRNGILQGEYNALEKNLDCRIPNEYTNVSSDTNLYELYSDRSIIIFTWVLLFWNSFAG